MGRPEDHSGIDPTTREIDEISAGFRRVHGHITKLQSRQLAWLKRWSRTERDERLRAYYLECHECGVLEVQHVASVMAQVLLNHAGHHTWLRMNRGSKYPGTWRR